MIILDFGSGTTCQNDPAIMRRMIDGLATADTGDKVVVIKWQLFAKETVPYVPALDLDLFASAYDYAAEHGYQTTASVFDEWSLNELLQFDVPFIKLACREWVYPLAGVVAAGEKYDTRVIASVADARSIDQFKAQWDVDCMCCVADYPANSIVYETKFGGRLSAGLSDHTTDFRLYHKYRPRLYECHYKLEDSTGPDAGKFARTPEQLREIL